MPHRHPLPLLSDDDLATLFAGDADAARRYRVLRAVVSDGVTQRDAAITLGVSERTVRNILRAYGRAGSLDALRTRRPGVRPGASRQPSAAEAALAAALAEEPLAGGDRLWRRAQELLAGCGLRLSRRTAYRILAQLRTRARRAPPADLAGAVRAGLPLLAEDPPLTLGAGALAQRLTPAGDALRRGAAVRQILRAAIERLRPAGAVAPAERAWWPYLICVGEYEDGLPRAEVQQSLALSASTYSRAKRQALDRIVAAVPQIASELAASPAAVACQRLPRTPDFVGRHEEQAYYARRLQREGRAYLWGLPGSGKTALAAEIAAAAHRAGLRVLWHTCPLSRESQALAVTRALAHALAAPDDLADPARTSADLPGLLDTIRCRLPERETLVVLDDAHRLDGAELDALLALLREAAPGPATRLLLVGRTPPAAGDWPTLPGLSDREARLLWVGAAPLPEDQWRALHEATGGLPQPLIRAAAQRRAADPGRPEDWTAEVAAWAEDAIWHQLAPDERLLLAAAHGVAARVPHVSLAALCRALALPPAALDRLQRAGLLRPGPAGPRVLGALHPTAARAAREDPDLSAAIERLATPTLAGAGQHRRLAYTTPWRP